MPMKIMRKIAAISLALAFSGLAYELYIYKKDTPKTEDEKNRIAACLSEKFDMSAYEVLTTKTLLGIVPSSKDKILLKKTIMYSNERYTSCKTFYPDSGRVCITDSEGGEVRLSIGELSEPDMGTLVKFIQCLSLEKNNHG